MRAMRECPTAPSIVQHLARAATAIAARCVQGALVKGPCPPTGADMNFVAMLRAAMASSSSRPLERSWQSACSVSGRSWVRIPQEALPNAGAYDALVPLLGRDACTSSASPQALPHTNKAAGACRAAGGYTIDVQRAPPTGWQATKLSLLKLRASRIIA